ncbi:hypothetical protein COV61_04095 [Candidatus Micrarchaeota archaeon CG11_big_fil_rev_8_21_14_0_20_47_5]|nr:MAG: hypothetical protein AUJ17_03785 [Candidatus Micrarchaeota archaeon CG1_02_47_40]PIN83096.1 MAG: hypothetical protein COV61_04095 [Candidatus Micrarchaeota archaeon CG11_big_fil_rev_8_21_14_0_20_47_5]
MKKAQISVELLVILGLSLAIMIPLILSAFSQAADSRHSLSISQADSVAQRLAAGADTLSHLGAGAKMVLDVQMPEGISEVKISPHEIAFTIEAYGKKTEIVKNSRAILSTSSEINLLKTAGNYQILLEALENPEHVSEVKISLYTQSFPENSGMAGTSS